MDTLANYIVIAGIGLTPRLSAVAYEALSLAQHLGGSVCFVHAGKDVPTTRAAIEAGLADLPFPGVARKLVIRPGRPDKVLCAEARSQNAQLLVAGALEKEGVLADLVGSTARRLARHAPCSVLLLPHPKMTGTAFERILAGMDKADAAAQVLGQ